MSINYFIGDLHLRHRNICKYRDFETADDHDNLIMENLRKCYGKRNQLWLLGDCFFSYKMKDFFKEICDNVGVVNVTLGNHCTQNSERLKLLREVMIEHENVNFHGIISKYGFWLSHAPVHPDELRGRKMNVHGHVHSSTIPDDRYLNLSAENIDFKPITLEMIRDIQHERGL